MNRRDQLQLAMKSSVLVLALSGTSHFLSSPGVVVAGPLDVYYYTANEPATIERIQPDGSGQTTLVTQGIFGTALKVNAPRNEIYFSDWDLGYIGESVPNKIYRSNLDGTGITTIVDDGGMAIFDIAVDNGAEKLYWTDAIGQTIRRSNFDGSNQETLRTSERDVYALDLDLSAGQMYWTNSATGEIRRSNLDGSSPETLLTLSDVTGLALDVAGGKMYFGSRAPSMSLIQRANLDGSGVETLYSIPGPFGAIPAQLALDLMNQQVYWTDESHGGIQYASMDGTGAVSSVPNVTEVAYALDLVAVPEPASVTHLVGVAIVFAGSMLIRRRRQGATRGNA
ncbi:MAG: DUF5050 domain-containing protein [Pirellulales bacterium]|nr:DUF5050 domain-containing protein [Pirellulales bacterium]